MTCRQAQLITEVVNKCALDGLVSTAAEQQRKRWQRRRAGLNVKEKRTAKKRRTRFRISGHVTGQH